MHTMKQDANAIPRVIALDTHPDSFTAAVLLGPTPAAGVVEKVFNKIPMTELQRWAKKNTTAEDCFVLEASGNSFYVVRSLGALSRQAHVLESAHLGRLKEAHANNDQISAVRIGKAYLAGTAKKVWVPDLKTQQRRDWLLAHDKAVRRTTQMRNRLRSYLSDNGVRLKKTKVSWIEVGALEALLRLKKDWPAQQWQVIEILLLELRHAEEQRRRWRSLIAQEVLADQFLLSIVRLCGVRDL